MDASMTSTKTTSVISFTYKNWKGNIEERTAKPYALCFGDSGEFHQHEYAWYLSAFCCERQADRLFLLRDISNFQIVEHGDADEQLIREIRQKLS
jgi:predicted DNA-binding transcriptional regulator YafY